MLITSTDVSVVIKQLANCAADLIRIKTDHIETLYRDLEFCRTLIKDWERNPYVNGKKKKNENANNLLMKQIKDVANKTKDAIQTIAINKGNNKTDIVLITSVFILQIERELERWWMNRIDKMHHNIRVIQDLQRENTSLLRVEELVANMENNVPLKQIEYMANKTKNAIRRIAINKRKNKTDIEFITSAFILVIDKIFVNRTYKMHFPIIWARHLPRANISLLREEELVVGFDDKATTIKEQLTRGQKQQDVISIVGMAGIGKTTFARKLYTDPLIIYHFYIRAWIRVSQEYQTQDLLRSLLNSVIQGTNDEISNEKLGEELRRRLKDKRYLIVMDDIWDTGAWVHLKSSFPNDNNGSRIMFTTRNEGVALQVKPDSHPFILRFLSEKESWDLFQHKAFKGKTCPPELTEIGKEIAKKCHGLPLTIVLAAGILANKEETPEQWHQVGKALSSSIVGEQCMETLALSYNHLPPHLKPCFLYFGVFPEDYEIRFHKLICLWIAEGFIQEIENKVVLEDLAEEYLLDLIGRSLVTVSKRRSDGGIKACHMHDLLREFCLKKAEEEYFLLRITGELFPCPFPKHFSNFRRLCIHPPIYHVSSSISSTLYTHAHSLLYIASRNIESQPLHFIYRCFTLLTVLDISSILIYSCSFLGDLEQVVLLRYLALGNLFSHDLFKGYNIPASISKLINLETLILRPSIPFVVLPHSIWKMVKLRHLWFTGNGKYRIERPVVNAADYPSSLDSLHTLSYVDPWGLDQDILTRTPNLRKLGFRGDIVSSAGLTFPDIHFLNHLKKLKLINTKVPTSSGWTTNLQGIKFPSILKSLTLERTYLKWDDMSSLSTLLPNLEVLKLANDACRGPSWETCGLFPRLRFLKFQSMKIIEWKLPSSDYFPSLQRLVFSRCVALERIPSKIGDIPTLQMIEVTMCSYSAELSAKEIQEEQRSMGNDGLQII